MSTAETESPVAKVLGDLSLVKCITAFLVRPENDRSFNPALRYDLPSILSFKCLYQEVMTRRLPLLSRAKDYLGPGSKTLFRWAVDCMGLNYEPYYYVMSSTKECFRNGGIRVDCQVFTTIRHANKAVNDFLECYGSAKGKTRCYNRLTCETDALTRRKGNAKLFDFYAENNGQSYTSGTPIACVLYQFNLCGSDDFGRFGKISMVMPSDGEKFSYSGREPVQSVGASTTVVGTAVSSSSSVRPKCYFLKYMSNWTGRVGFQFFHTEEACLKYKAALVQVLVPGYSGEVRKDPHHGWINNQKYLFTYDTRSCDDREERIEIFEVKDVSQSYPPASMDKACIISTKYNIDVLSD